MVVKFKQISDDGMCEFRTFQMAYPTERSNQALKSMRFDVDLLKQTRSTVDTSALFGKEPQVDAANESGNFCSVNSLCNASGGAIDYGLAGHLARVNKSFKPDALINGRAHWRAGASAKSALAKFKTSAAAPRNK